MSSEDDINAIVRTTLQTKILAAVKSAPEAIDLMIKAALEKPVDPMTGKNDGYGGYNKVPYLEYLTGEVIRDAVRTAVGKHIQELLPAIETAVHARLTADDMARALTKAMVDATSKDWQIKVSIEREESRR